MPASTIPATLVFLALESVSATPYSPSLKPTCSNQASAQRVSASKSPSCSASVSSRRLIYERQCFAHREWLACSIKHLGIASEYCHAWADRCLRQVYRRNIASL